MNKQASRFFAVRNFVVVVATVIFLAGCTLMLGDNVNSRMLKLVPSSCPDLSGRYALGGTTLRSISGQLEERMSEDILIGYLPTDQKNMVDDIYESFFDFNRPFRISFRKEKMSTYPKKFDYVLDGNKTKGAHVVFILAGANEYVVNVYSNSNQLLGAFRTALLSKNSGCFNDKYYTFLQDPTSHMVGEDWAFTTKRSSGEVMIYRSASGGLVRATTGRKKAVVIGIIPTTQPESQTITTFPTVH